MSEERFKSPLCEEGDHEGCSNSSMMGICGCECHDHLDELDEMLYGGSAGHTHDWKEVRRVTEPNESGDYRLVLWDEKNYMDRKVPSAYYECSCGDSLISPLELRAGRESNG